MDSSLLAKAHSGIAILVFVIYIIRGVLMLTNSTRNNSILVLSTASVFTILFIALGLYGAHLQKLSFTDGFVATKLACLLVFLILGSISLKQGLSKTVAIILWLLGLCAFVYAALIGTHMLNPLF